MSDQEIKILIDDYQSSFPLPFVLLVIGYAFILLIDRVLIDSHSSDTHNDHSHDHDSSARPRSDSVDSFGLQRTRSRSLQGSEKRPGRINEDGQETEEDDDEEQAKRQARKKRIAKEQELLKA